MGASEPHLDGVRQEGRELLQSLKAWSLSPLADSIDVMTRALDAPNLRGMADAAEKLVAGAMSVEPLRADVLRTADQVLDLAQVEVALRRSPPSPREEGATPAGIVERASDVWDHLEARGHLRGLRVRGVSWSGSLAGVVDGADLRESIFEGAVFVKPELGEAKLDGARLRRCLLIGARGAGVAFTGCDLSNASLRDAELCGADLSDVVGFQLDMRGADLSGAHLERFAGEGVDARGANFEGANFDGADFRGATFDDARMTRLVAREACLMGARLVKVDLSTSDLSDARFDHADLSHAKLAACIVAGASLDGALLHRADMSDTDLSRTSQRNTRPTDERRAQAEDFAR